MNIQEYADIINIDIEVKYFNNQNRWCANFKGVETKDVVNDGILTGSFANGGNPHDAIENYIRAIKGKILVINATGGDKRREYKVPQSLEL